MSTRTIHCDVPAQRVWEVLADPGTYADWVVGAHNIRDADPEWPAEGAKLHHQVGTRFANVNDHTQVEASEPPHRLVLRARARPFGTARVELAARDDGSGCTVTIQETAGDPLSYVVLNPLTNPLVDRRNEETLRRLKRIAETGVVKPGSA